MKSNRRDFLKLIGVTGGAIATSSVHSVEDPTPKTWFVEPKMIVEKASAPIHSQPCKYGIRDLTLENETEIFANDSYRLERRQTGVRTVTFTAYEDLFPTAKLEDWVSLEIPEPNIFHTTCFEGVLKRKATHVSFDSPTIYEYIIRGIKNV